MIELTNISKSFGKKTLYKDLSLNLAEVGLLMIQGRSGSGKTTLINAIYNHKKIRKLTISYNQIRNYLIKNESVINNVKYIFHLYEQNYIKDNITSLFEKLQINNTYHIKFENLSAGQKQRVGIAISLLLAADIMIIDEPYSELDKTNRDIVLNLLLERSKTSLVIFTIHEKVKIDNAILVNKVKNNNLTIYNFEYENYISKEKKQVKPKIKNSRFFLLSNIFSWYLIGIVIILISFSFALNSFFEQQISSFDETNTYNQNIYYLENSHEGLTKIYDNIFDNITSILSYEQFGYTLDISVSAVPVEILLPGLELKDNEIIISSNNKVYQSKNLFDSFNMNSLTEIKGKVVTFNEKKYIVKDVLDLKNNIVLVNRSLLENFRLSNSLIYEPKIYDDKVEVVNGRIPAANSDYIEIVAPSVYNINDILDEKYLVVGHSKNNYYYLNKDAYIKSYLNLPSITGKVLYSKDIREDKAFLTINSVNYKDIYNDQEEIIKESRNEYINSTNFIKNTFNYASIIFFWIITIIGLIKLSSELRLRGFSSTKIKRNFIDFLNIIINKNLPIILFSIIFIKAITLIINYVYTYSINFNYAMFFTYMTILIGIEILLIIVMTLYLKIKKFK